MKTAGRNLKSVTVVMSLLLAIGLISSMALAAPAALPPRPGPISGPSNNGGLIQLQLANVRATVWTVVQWQDALGGWHDVEGWRGTLDSISNGTGYKTWWVAPGDFGKGPFRWVVYDLIGGQLLVSSEAFNLPSNSHQMIVSDVSLNP
jgi:hypothetical protein